MKTFKEWLKNKNEGLMSSDGQQYGGGNTPNGTITPNQARDKVNAAPAVGAPSTSTMVAGKQAMRKLMKK